MLEKISAYVEKYHMLQAGDTVVAGISGGADSVCLLFMLREMQKRIPFTLLGAHVDHGKRQRTLFLRRRCVRGWGSRFFWKRWM